MTRKADDEPEVGVDWNITRDPPVRLAGVPNAAVASRLAATVVHGPRTLALDIAVTDRPRIIGVDVLEGPGLTPSDLRGFGRYVDDAVALATLKVEPTRDGGAKLTPMSSAAARRTLDAARQARRARRRRDRVDLERIATAYRDAVHRLEAGETTESVYTQMNAALGKSRGHLRNLVAQARAAQLLPPTTPRRSRA